MAPFDACSAALALFRINYCKVVGLGHRVFDTIVIDSSKYATTAAATVADIANPFHHVAHGVNQTDLLGFVEELKRLLPGNIERARRAIQR